ncbi:hypothetical protein PSHT_16430 [Puccinia striiformis]|uniref:Tet-like 2OG-Fe(II) oxygenase domain-containing protein n=1 Tax=Puccinia striiformis TaxID=27350 RepID=A0A2S4UA00_9BASI|nr:hypothetical protein PSHT_16430 [Puccinia striiformis]
MSYTNLSLSIPMLKRSIFSPTSLKKLKTQLRNESHPHHPKSSDLAEIASAASHVEENFKLYDHGHAKKFVSPVASKGRSCAGTIVAIGWRKAMKRFEILGRYTRKANIASSPKNINVILQIFVEPIGFCGRCSTSSVMSLFKQPRVHEEIQHPSLDTDNHTDDNSSPFNFSSNLTFTSNGFF